MGLLTDFSIRPTVPSTPAPTCNWMYVSPRFERFLGNLRITADQEKDGVTKLGNVISTLNRAYWDINSDTTHRILIGSWAKGASVRPPRDIDVLFIPPNELYHQFNRRTGNRQSQLLQNCAEVLRLSYPQTIIRADGQVIVVGFNSVKIEVAPAFPYQPGGFLICDTNNNGQWKNVDPNAETTAFNSADFQHNGNVRKLTRILKQWQRHCNVPIKSFHLEAIVKDLLPTKSYGGNHEFWFDWLVRDVFLHMIECANGSFIMPGCANEKIEIGNMWLSKAQSAYERSVRACAHEYNNANNLAGHEWQKIFGTMIPLTAS